MRLKGIVKKGLIVLVLLLCFAGAGYGGIMWYIHGSTQKYCRIAQEAYPHPGDDVAALIKYMNSNEHSLRQRNLTVWALGRLRDPAALEALKANYKGQKCDHERRLCERELEKAIKLCGGEI